MQKVLRVLIVIAIVICLVQLLDLITELIPTNERDSESFALSYAKTTLINWLVFWPSGLATLIVGILTRKSFSLLGNSLAISGVYLMMLGNNGGVWAVGHELLRLVTSTISLAILILLAIKLDKQELTAPHQPSIAVESGYSELHAVEK
jgi:hypothetical protein